MTLLKDLAGKYMSKRGFSAENWDSTSQKEMLAY